MLFDRNGGETWASTTYWGDQRQGKVAALQNGTYVVAYRTAGLSGSGVHESIRFQRYSAAGQPLGGDTYLNTVLPTGTHVYAPAVASLSAGGYVIAWTRSDAAGYVLMTQSFTADGAAVGAAATVAGSEGGGSATLTRTADGGYALFWAAPDSSGSGIKGQMFAAGGTPAGAIFAVNTITASEQVMPVAATLADGRVVVAWTDWSGQSGEISLGAKAQIFASDGTPIGSEFRVNTTAAGNQSLSSVAALPSGGFVAVWQTNELGTNDVKAQLFDALGNKIGDELLVNSVLDGSQGEAAVTALSDGGFLVSWTSWASAREGSVGLSAGIFAQAFDSSGAKTGSEFLVNTTIKGDQSESALATLASGNVVSIWTDASQIYSGNNVGTEVYRQVFKPHAAITTIAASASAVSEVAFGNAVAASLSSNAAVNGDVRYQLLADSTGGGFRLEGNRLVVADNGRLDWEAAPSVTLTIRATEAGGGYYDKNLVFSVTNSAGELRYSAADSVVWRDAPGDFTAAYAESSVRLTTGEILVVWTEPASSGRSYVGQLADESGAKIGSSFALGDPSLLHFDSVTALPGGGFAVGSSLHVFTGTSDPATANYGDAILTLYGPDGAAVAPAIMLNASTPGAQENVKLDVLSDGTLLAVWRDTQHPAGSGQQGVTSVHAQKFDLSGNRIGGDFELPVSTSKIAALPGGGFVAITGQGVVRAQIFDNDGHPIGAEIQVAAHEGGGQSQADIEVLSDGRFVISWTDYSHYLSFDSWNGGIKAQMFEPWGTKVGREFLVNTVTADEQNASSITALPAGGFVISWMDYSTYSTSSGTMEDVGNIKAQIYDPAGLAVGGEFQVNQKTAGSQVSPNLVAGPSGAILAFWSDDAPVYTNDDFVALRIFAPSPGGTAGDDRLTGGTNPDTISGIGGNDEISGGAGADRLFGGAGDDILQGGLGNDFLDGGAGADQLSGGVGDDVYVVDSDGDQVAELAGEGTDEVRTGLGSAAALYALAANVENLVGTSNTGQGVAGNTLDNVITTGTGNDAIDLSSGGNDTANGNGGDDYVYFGGAFTAADTVVGGAGTDTVGLLGTYNLTLAANTLSGVENFNLLSGTAAGGSEHVTYAITTVDANVPAGGRLTVYGGGLLADETLFFNGYAETDGALSVYGGAGNDTFAGGPANDAFVGGAGDDLMYGLGGMDWLEGGLGADSMRGGPGNDLFVYQSAAESTAAKTDHILDFEEVSDHIDLTRIDSNASVGGDQAFTFIGSSAFSNTAGELRAYQSNGSWFVEGDVNGDGTADLVIQVDTFGGHVMAASDFLL